MGGDDAASIECPDDNDGSGAAMIDRWYLRQRRSCRRVITAFGCIGIPILCLVNVLFAYEPDGAVCHEQCTDDTRYNELVANVDAAYLRATLVYYDGATLTTVPVEKIVCFLIVAVLVAYKSASEYLESEVHKRAIALAMALVRPSPSLARTGRRTDDGA